MASTTPAAPRGTTPAASSLAAPAATPTAPEPDWPAQAADVIVEQVGKVRDKTTGPALKIARYVIFGAFATLLGTVALLLFVIGAVRALDVYLPDAAFGETHMWAAHSLLGALFVLGGLLTSRKMRGAKD